MCEERIYSGNKTGGLMLRAFRALMKSLYPNIQLYEIYQK
jgi:hypothetical protein